MRDIKARLKRLEIVHSEKQTIIIATKQDDDSYLISINSDTLEIAKDEKMLNKLFEHYQKEYKELIIIKDEWGA